MDLFPGFILLFSLIFPRSFSSLCRPVSSLKHGALFSSWEFPASFVPRGARSRLRSIFAGRAGAAFSLHLFSAFSFLLFLVAASSGRKKSSSPARLARRELRNRSLSAIRARDRLCESPPLPMTAARAGAFCRRPPGAHDSSVRTSFVAPAFLGRVAAHVGAVGLVFGLRRSAKITH